MARSYDETVAERRARLSPEGQQQRAVFEQAYDIAMQVIELREKHGLTQAELAARCGMDQADISRIERGSTSPTVRTLQRIANALSADLRLIERAA
jgi:ribosome-binding protein aMBF1 (putative translation factor)